MLHMVGQVRCINFSQYSYFIIVAKGTPIWKLLMSVELFVLSAESLEQCGDGKPHNVLNDSLTFSLPLSLSVCQWHLSLLFGGLGCVV